MARRKKTITLTLLILLVLVPFIGVKPVVACEEGCTPGYWKNHTDAWVGHHPDDLVDSVFVVPYTALADDTLLEALSYKGGPGEDGAARILLRAAVASLLNASHTGIDGPGTVWLVGAVNDALAEDRGSMLSRASLLDRWNNLGCPL